MYVRGIDEVIIFIIYVQLCTSVVTGEPDCLLLLKKQILVICYFGPLTKWNSSKVLIQHWVYIFCRTLIIILYILSERCAVYFQHKQVLKTSSIRYELALHRCYFIYEFI